MRAEDVDTPAMIVETDALECNLRRRAAAAASAGARLLPHAKMHKCPALALRQVAPGVLFSVAGATRTAIGAKLRLIAGHVDATVNLHDWLVCVRDGVAEALWPVSARGAMW